MSIKVNEEINKESNAVRNPHYPLTFTALNFGVLWHTNHERKYTKLPYMVHPVEVMSILQRHGIDEDEIFAAALLHDAVEDTATDNATICRVLNDDVGYLVAGLTDVAVPSDGNRAERMRLNREHVGRGDWRVQSIKCADCISNGKDIWKNDKDFAVVYFKEMTKLLPHLALAKPSLIRCLEDLIFAYDMERRRLQGGSDNG
jgi:(p)ppGpp synthase/HD superfamily hydrolase